MQVATAEQWRTAQQQLGHPIGSKLHMLADATPAMLHCKTHVLLAETAKLAAPDLMRWWGCRCMYTEQPYACIPKEHSKNRSLHAATLAAKKTVITRHKAAHPADIKRHGALVSQASTPTCSHGSLSLHHMH
jgi:hypothetical protein